MKHLSLFVLLFCFAAAALHSQNVRYAYDNAGNRVARTIVLSQSSPAPESEEAEATALTDVVSEHAVKIYPNPTQGMLTVEIVDFSPEMQADFSLTDMNGKIIDRQKAVSNRLTFNLSNQPSGIYLLRIGMKGESTTWKIIKE